MTPIPQPDFDARWKDIIEQLHPWFILFFFADLAPKIDWTVPVRVLDKELQILLADWKTKGKRIGDLLLEYQLKSGEKHFVLVHIEVQHKFEKDFSWRMFCTFTRLIQKYSDRKITAIAIYTGDKTPAKYNSWTYDYHGTKMNYEFPSYLVRKQNEQELLAADNPFALVVLTCLYLLQAKKQYKNKYEWLKTHKIKLARLCFEKGYSRQIIENLLIFVSFTIALHEEDEKTYQKEINNLLKFTTMPLVDENPLMAEVIEVSLYGKTLKERDKERDEVRAPYFKKEQMKKSILKSIEFGLDKALIAAINDVSVAYIEQTTLDNSILKLHQDKMEIAAIADTLNVKTALVIRVIHYDKIFELYLQGMSTSVISDTLKIDKQLVEKVMEEIREE